MVGEISLGLQALNIFRNLGPRGSLDWVCLYRFGFYVLLTIHHQAYRRRAHESHGNRRGIQTLLACGRRSETNGISFRLRTVSALMEICPKVMGLGFYGRSFTLTSADCQDPGCVWVSNAIQKSSARQADLLIGKRSKSRALQRSIRNPYVQ
jgi:hypothetical protein